MSRPMDYIASCQYCRAVHRGQQPSLYYCTHKDSDNGCLCTEPCLQSDVKNCKRYLAEIGLQSMNK